jgi:hypothetical protein
VKWEKTSEDTWLSRDSRYLIKRRHCAFATTRYELWLNPNTQEVVRLAQGHRYLKDAKAHAEGREASL